MEMLIKWDQLAELIKEYGEAEGVKIFLELVLCSASIKRQVDELDKKEETNG
jgi:hypothetical protein